MTNLASVLRVLIPIVRHFELLGSKLVTRRLSAVASLGLSFVGWIRNATLFEVRIATRFAAIERPIPLVGVGDDLLAFATGFVHVGTVS